MPIAYNFIRNQPHYRRDAFDKGLEAAGYEVREYGSGNPQPGDILVIWNRYGGYEEMADIFEKAGNKVIIVENGYYGDNFALSLGQHHHGGAGFPLLANKKIKAAAGKHVLICAQRGIGSTLMKSPPAWAEMTAAKIRPLTKREIRIRPHPGKYPPQIPLADDLRDCHACLIWHSAAGIDALLSDVQVFYDAPMWIAAASALPLSKIISGECDINATYDYTNQGINFALFNQWSVKSIADGSAFKRLLEEKNAK